jgi:hypothetical protein
MKGILVVVVIREEEKQRHRCTDEWWPLRQFCEESSKATPLTTADIFHPYRGIDVRGARKENEKKSYNNV